MRAIFLILTLVLGWTVLTETRATEEYFVHEGINYVLVNGDVYRDNEDHSRTFEAHLFDPDYIDTNYVADGGQVYQINPEDPSERYPITRQFSETFEQDLGLMSAERWHSNNADPADAGQPTNYYNLGNRVTRVTTIDHSGSASMKFFANPSTQTSKASLAKNIMFYQKGDTVWFDGWFYLASTPSVYDVGGFSLFDLESTFMQSIGLRAMIRPGDALAFELEFPKTQFNQDVPVPFPTGQWVHVVTGAYLSDDPEQGQVMIWQNDALVLDKHGRTLPFANTIYDRFEIGITALAAGSEYSKTLYMDDVQISDTFIP